jgi:hypothetical protein
LALDRERAMVETVNESRLVEEEQEEEEGEEKE